MTRRLSRVRSALARAVDFARLPQSQAWLLREARNAARERSAPAMRDAAAHHVERRRAQAEVLGSAAALPEPEHLLGLVRSVVERRPKLRLLEIRPLPPSVLAAGEPMHAPDAAAASPALAPAPTGATPAAGDAARLYEHPMELAVAGDVATLVEFASSLPTSNMPVIWDAVHLLVKRGSSSVMLLRMCVISRQARWLPSSWGV